MLMGIIKICDNKEEREEEKKNSLGISFHNGFEDDRKDNNGHSIVGLYVVQPI